jgi:hypothetical protein
MAYPKITYTIGSAVTTLAFTYPPTQVAAYNAAATRHDNLSSSGVRESILERIDNFLEISMAAVLSGTDVQNWNSLMQYALQGGQFSYYPDASQSGFTNYLLEGTTWQAAYRAPGLYKFKLKFRQVVT